MPESGTLSVWSNVGEEEVKSAFPRVGSSKGAGATSEVATQLFSQNLQRFLREFEAMVDEAETPDSKFNIDQVELNVVVNANGGIELIGKLNAGVEASMKVTLRRKANDQ